MTEPNPTPSTTTRTPHQQESTFRNYDSKAADNYAAYRPSYNPKLIDLILNTHTTTGGKTDFVVDLGCGPGIATRLVAPLFQRAYGLDASPGMIAKAQTMPYPSASGEPVVFQVYPSEEIDQLFEPQSVDLITVATAAHWFDMPKFYVAASKVLKPSGSIAMWCGGGWWVDPKTTPNADAVQKKWTELEVEILHPFEEPGNRLSRELYKDLELPWTITPEIAGFDPATSSRRVFNEDGKPEQDPLLADTRGFMQHRRLNLQMAAKLFGTASPVARWREAHKAQLDKGEIEDCVDRMLRQTREEMAKVEGGEDRDWVECGIQMVLIIVKKKAEAV